MQRDQSFIGLMLMLAFAITAPVIDVFAKLTPDEIPVLQVAASRFVLQSALLLPIALFLGVIHRPAKEEAALHVLRALLILIATGAFFQALRFMPIADAIAIFFVEPLILTLLGGLLLSEEIGPRRIIACLTGFLGTLLVIRPSFAAFGVAALLPLATALLFAFYMLLTRRMAQRMHPVTLQGYTAFAAALIVTPILIAFSGSDIAMLTPVLPSAWGWTTLIGVGLAATSTHLLLSFALRLAPAATIAPLHYIEIASAAVFGFLVFGDFPEPLTFLGIAIITASGLFVILRERQLSKVPKVATTAK